MEASLRKILITGGNGFLARSFAEKLDYPNNDIVICSRKELDLNDSVVVKTFLHEQQFDVVLHAATYDAAPKNSPKDSEKVLENNLRMFFNLARCRQDYGKMIFFGSGAEFGRENWQPKMDESFFDKHVPTDQYGYSKYLMTQFAQQTNNIFNLRLFGVFGELDDWRYRFISNICCHAVLDKMIRVHQNKKVDFLDIHDLCLIVSWFIENQPKEQVYNVCSGQAFEFKWLAEKIQSFTNGQCDLVINNQRVTNEYSGNNQKLLSEIGGFEFTPISQSLERLFEWYKRNSHTIDAEQLHF